VGQTLGNVARLSLETLGLAAAIFRPLPRRTQKCNVAYATGMSHLVCTAYIVQVRAHSQLDNHCPGELDGRLGGQGRKQEAAVAESVTAAFIQDRQCWRWTGMY
jgi:hypothetical protein